MRNLLCLVLICSALSACTATRENEHPVCDVRSPTILMAEAVKTAALIPCVRSLQIGWSFSGFDAQDGRAIFTLSSEAGGRDALSVELTRGCPAQDGSDVARSDEPGTSLRTRIISSRDPYEARWRYTFEGGCATYDLAFVNGAPVDRLQQEIVRSISFIPRSWINQQLEASSDRPLEAVSP
jgi:hypothetical protein